MDAPAPDLAARLAAIPALADLSPACRAALAGIARPRTYRPEDAILRAGEKASSLYVLLDGRVKMQRDLANGRSVVLALFDSGEIFGTVAALGGAPCDASMVALSPSFCLEIARRDLLALLEARPALLGELLPVLARPLAECKNCIVELTCYRVETRLAHLLLKLADRLGRPAAGGTWIPIRLSRQELADMTGTTIETCIRVMSRFGKEGLIETRRDGFLLRDRRAVERLTL
ncbi:MAG: Crp/Fnr family transcriptional regulator [Acidobacteria bacterium]|nr:MAG: Crp/Fnr family transcriptional regulator [Acidobacteriota bacterium]